jgi:hypothetical protein
VQRSIIDYILEQFEAMGATEDELWAEYIDMLMDRDHLIHNIQLLDIGERYDIHARRQ